MKVRSAFRWVLHNGSDLFKILLKALSKGLDVQDI